MKNYLFLGMMVISQVIFAQDFIEPCKFGQPLIDALQDSYTPNNPLGYGPARDILYSEIDNVGNDLSGVYTNFTVTLDPSADPSVSAFQNGAGLNAEHVYPQSLGAGSEPMRSDLHNIFPCKVNVNESRGSCPYGEVDDDDTDIWYYLAMQANNIPSSEIDNYSEKDQEDCVFEPRESVKGDIARAIFYFYGIYQNTADGINSNFFPQQKATLYQWHINDPVDAKEMTRNGLIAGEQGNLNPFISDSTLVRRAYFEADASYPDGDPNCFSLSTSVQNLNAQNWVELASNIVTKEVILFSTENSGNVLLCDLQGRVVSDTQLLAETRVSVNGLASGFYVIQISNADGAQKVFRVFVK